MSVWSTSLTGRAVGIAGDALSGAWAASGSRAVAQHVLSVLGPTLLGSRLLSVRGSRLLLLPVPAAAPEGVLVPGQTGGAVARLLIRFYVLILTLLGQSTVGRFFRALGASWEGSLFAGGGWLLVAGGGVAGAAGALLAGALSQGSGFGVAIAVALLCAGLGLASLAAFPRCGRASVAGRAAEAVGLLGPSSGTPAVAPTAGRAVSGAATLGAAALMAYLTSRTINGALTMSALTVALFVSSFLLYRAEALLPLIAAFPWVDYVVRRVLGAGLGGYWDEALLLGALVAVVFSALVLGRSRHRSGPALFPLVVAVVLAVGSVVINEVPNHVAQFALRITFEPFLFYLVVAWCPKERRWIKAAVAVFIVAGLLLALHGLYQFASNAPMPASWVDTHEDIGTRAYSILDNPNGLGNYLLLGTVLSAALALSRIRRLWRIVAGASTLVLMAGLAVTFSRGAYIGLVAGLVAMVLLAFRPWLGRLALMAVVGAVLVPQRFVDRLLFGFSSYYVTLSQANGRLYAWRIALYRMAEHPWFGVGLGTLGGTSSYLAGYSRLWIDNFYLQMVAEAGLPLLLAFVWLLARVAKGIVASRGVQSDPLYRGVGAGALGAFVAVAVAAVFTSSWENLAVGAGFWFLAGLASSLPAADEPVPALPLARELEPVARVFCRVPAHPALGSRL